MRSKAGRVFRVAVALLLGLALLPLAAAPAGAVSALSITSPTELDPAYIAPPGYINVDFTFTPEATSATVNIEVFDGATVIGSKEVTYTGLTSGTPAPKTESVYISAAAADAAYDLSVAVDDGVSAAFATESDAVVVTRAAPTVTIEVSDDLINESVATFRVIATFSKPMDTAATPTIAFDPDLTAAPATLVFSTDAWSEGDTVYTVTYTVTDNNEEVSGVDVSVGGARDKAGNVQEPDPTVAADLFDVDTSAPELTSIAWTDVDDSRGINEGDTLLFTFTQAMDTSTVTSDNLDTMLPISGGVTRSRLPWEVASIS